MPLRLVLKPRERLIINGASLRNGDRPTELLIENHCKFLRETEIIYESDADTACKKLGFTLQAIYLADDVSEFESLFVAQAGEIIAGVPSMAPYVAVIYEEINRKQYHRAIKAGKKLIAYEQALQERLTKPSDAA
ncbi:MAG TPA: flagellar biosynthesis repressor FlbT [Methylobacterium sp.]|jgi:flagellar protein FlbT